MMGQTFEFEFVSLSLGCSTSENDSNDLEEICYWECSDINNPRQVL